MTAQERKDLLKAAGVTQADICRRTGFKPPYVHEVVKGTRANKDIQRAIARAVGKPLAEVFPRQRRAVQSAAA